jgi:hypothetical protein
MRDPFSPDVSAWVGFNDTLPTGSPRFAPATRGQLLTSILTLWNLLDANINAAQKAGTGYHGKYGSPYGYMRPMQLQGYVQVTQRPGPRTYCEIGVNGGHGTAAMLLANPEIVAHSFDMGSYGYSNQAYTILSLYFGERFKLHRGDSSVTLPAWIAANPNATCDVILVDGDHREKGSYTDMVNMRKLSGCNSTLLIDDITVRVSACPRPARASARLSARARARADASRRRAAAGGAAAPRDGRAEAALPAGHVGQPVPAPRAARERAAALPARVGVGHGALRAAGALPEQAPSRRGRCWGRRPRGHAQEAPRGVTRRRRRAARVPPPVQRRRGAARARQGALGAVLVGGRAADATAVRAARTDGWGERPSAERRARTGWQRPAAPAHHGRALQGGGVVARMAEEPLGQHLHNLRQAHRRGRLRRRVRPREQRRGGRAAQPVRDATRARSPPAPPLHCPFTAPSPSPPQCTRRRAVPRRPACRCKC